MVTTDPSLSDGEDDESSHNGGGSSSTASEGEQEGGTSEEGRRFLDFPGFDSPANSQSHLHDDPEVERSKSEASASVGSNGEGASGMGSNPNVLSVADFPEAVPVTDTWKDEDVEEGPALANKEPPKGGLFGWGKKKGGEENETREEENFRDEPVSGSNQRGGWFDRKKKKGQETIPDGNVDDGYGLAPSQDYVDPGRPDPKYHGQATDDEPWDSNSKGASRWSSIEATKERKIITCLTLVVCCFCWLVMLAIGIGIGISIGRRDESSSPKALTTEPPSSTPVRGPSSPITEPSIPSAPTTASKPTVRPSASQPTVRPVVSQPTVRPSSQPTVQPSVRPTATLQPSVSPTLEPLLGLLVESSFDNGQTLLSAGTPQRDAYEWLRSSEGIDALPEAKILSRYALATFFYSTNGPTTWDPAIRNNGWMTAADECEWSSTVAAVCADGIFTSLTLDFVGISGELPLEIGHLTGLTRLSVRGNATSGETVTGTIPFSFGNLVNMETIRLDENRIGGTIPTEIGLMTNLGVFVLSGNVVGGEIPSEIGTIKGTFITFDNNEIRGKIPSELFQLTDLTTLNLQNNFLSGPLPSEIGNLANINALDLSINDLTGVIPTGKLFRRPLVMTQVNNMPTHMLIVRLAEIGRLTGINTGINLATNDFVGPLPSEIGFLVAMSKCRLTTK
jgi:hypothetical protein